MHRAYARYAVCYRRGVWRNEDEVPLTFRRIALA